MTKISNGYVYISNKSLRAKSATILLDIQHFEEEKLSPSTQEIMDMYRSLLACAFGVPKELIQDDKNNS